jgi:hypothetical protein
MKKLKIGDSVRVKEGTGEFFLESYDLSGWQGRIKDIFYDECWETGRRSKYVRVEYDSITLRQMTKKYYYDKIFFSHKFAIADILYKKVDPVKPRDTIEEVEAAKTEVFEKYHWEA